MMTRKQFLGLAGAVPFACARAAEAGRPNAVFGVLSDIHVVNEKSRADFEKALEWYKARGVDGVAIPGDLADFGQLDELQMVADTWKKVFPGGCGLGGKKVEYVMIGGNHEFGNVVWKRKAGHELKGQDPEKLKVLWETTWKKDPKAGWEKCFGTPFEPIGIKEIKGYKFVYCHHSFEPGIEKFLTEHAAELKNGKPFFYLQHCAIKNTCYLELKRERYAAVKDNNAVHGRRFALEKMPQAIALTGDVHNTLLDDRHLWQGDYTVINCASFRYTTAPYRGAENAHWKRAYAATRPPAQLPTITLDKTNKQGMVFFLYDDHLAIERWDLFNYEKAAPDWVIPLGADGAPAKVFTEATRGAQYLDPAWPTEAKATAKGPVKGVNRDKKPTEQILVSWPAARNDEHRRRTAFYRIEAQDAAGKKLAEKKLVPKNFARALVRLTDAESCPFAVGEFPAGTELIRFSVVAEGLYGHKSPPLVCEWRKS